MEQQQLQQKLVQLKGDILLTERNLQKLNSDLEQLQQTKVKALKEYDFQKKEKETAIEVLATQQKELESAILKHKSTIDELLSEIVKIKDESIHEAQIAKEAVQTIYSDAENTRKAVVDREENVTIREKKAEERKDLAEVLIKQAQKDIVKNDIRMQELDMREQQIRTNEIDSKKAIDKAQELLDDIDRQLITKRMEIQRLDQVITRKTAIAENTGKDAEARLKEVERREFIVAGEENGLHEKHKELIQKERWLDDREATMARAYREIIQRGGNIN